MRKGDLFDSRQVEKWLNALPEGFFPLVNGVPEDLSNIENLGVVLTHDSRPALRVQEDLTTDEAYALIRLMENLSAVFYAAVDLQRERALAVRELQDLLSDLKIRKMPTDKRIAKAVQTYKRITEDAQC